MTPKQILKSFTLEGKINQRHAQEIEEILTEALRERDKEWYRELLTIKSDIETIGKLQDIVDRVTGVKNYRPLLDKKE